MAMPPITEQQARETVAAYERFSGNITEIARFLGVARSSVYNRLDRARAVYGLGVSVATEDEPPRPFIAPELPSADEPLEELLARRRADSERTIRAAEARELIPVQIRTPGPIGLLIVGDPHIDDPGCDFVALERHLTVAKDRTEYLFACGIGDLQNAWPGRLTRLYAKQATTVSDAWRLVEWMMTFVPWLFLVRGNHDNFVGDNDPLKWIMRGNPGPVENHGVRLALHHPCGAETRIHARHDFKGASMYNDMHGLVRELREGFRDHILVAGHRHIGAESAIVNPEGHISQLVRVAGYKVVDDYAKEGGYKAKPIHRSALVIIDPSKADGDRERVWLAPSVEVGAEYLDWLRARYDGRKPRVTVKAA